MDMDLLLWSTDLAIPFRAQSSLRCLRVKESNRYVLSFAEYSLRNLATFGATTAVQYPWNGFREKYS